MIDAAISLPLHRMQNTGFERSLPSVEISEMSLIKKTASLALKILSSLFSFILYVALKIAAIIPLAKSLITSIALKILFPLFQGRNASSHTRNETQAPSTEEFILRNRQNAAKCIQSRFRKRKAYQSFQNIKKKYFLEETLNKDLWKNKNALYRSMGTMPRANDGKTEVYLPENFSSVVLKKSGGDSSSRLQKTILAKNIAAKKALHRLTIPKVRLLGIREFIVEERLPLGRTDYFSQTQLYLHYTEKHPLETSQLIQEFMHFVLLTGLNDLLDTRRFPFSTPRYDNIPFFESMGGEKTLQIGLIDLESLQRNPSRKKTYFSSLSNLALIFPYHLEELKNIAPSYGSANETALLQLEKIAEQAKSNIKEYVVRLSKRSLKKNKLDMHLQEKEIEKLIKNISPETVKENRLFSNEKYIEEIMPYAKEIIKALLPIVHQEILSQKREPSHLIDRILSFNNLSSMLKKQGVRGLHPCLLLDFSVDILRSLQKLKHIHSFWQTGFFTHIIL